MTGQLQVKVGVRLELGLGGGGGERGGAEAGCWGSGD